MKKHKAKNNIVLELLWRVCYVLFILLIIIYVLTACSNSKIESEKILNDEKNKNDSMYNKVINDLNMSNNLYIGDEDNFKIGIVMCDTVIEVSDTEFRYRLLGDTAIYRESVQYKIKYHICKKVISVDTTIVDYKKIK